MTKATTKLLNFLKSNLRLLIILIAVALLSLLAWKLPVKDWLLSLLEWTENLDPKLAIPIVILSYIIACVFCLPVWILTVSCGFLFKITMGTLVVSLGQTLGVCAAFLVAKTLAGKTVAKKLTSRPKFEAIDKAISSEGFKIVLLTRLSFLFPYNILNYIYGLTKVKFTDYALGSWLGMLPATIMYVYCGAALNELTEVKQGVNTGPVGKVFLYIGLFTAIIVSVIIARIANNAIKKAKV